METGELKRRFGKRVQRLREAAGLTQEQLADRIARSVDTVSNIERGVNATRIEVAYQIAIELGVTLPQLFSLEAASPTRARLDDQMLVLRELLQHHDDATIRNITDLVRIGLTLVRERDSDG